MRTVFLLVLVLLTGCGVAARSADGTGAPPAASRAAPPTMHPDAAAYAADFDVSVEEASRRLARSGAIDRLQAILQASEPTFVALQLQHEPDYRIIATFTADSVRPLDEYVAGTELAGLVELRRVQYTLDNLIAIRDAAQQAIDTAGIRTTAQIDERNQRVTVGVFNPQRLDRALATAGVALPDGAMVVQETPSVQYVDPDVVPTPVAQQSVRHFPQQLTPDGTRATMAALLEGELLLVDGCLRVSGWGDDSALIIWPPDVVLDAGTDPIALRDVAGNVIARVGERVAVGGGELWTDFDPATSGSWLRDLHTSCTGPYFLAADLTE